MGWDRMTQLVLGDNFFVRSNSISFGALVWMLFFTLQPHPHPRVLIKHAVLNGKYSITVLRYSDSITCTTDE